MRIVDLFHKHYTDVLYKLPSHASMQTEYQARARTTVSRQQQNKNKHSQNDARKSLYHSHQPKTTWRLCGRCV